MFQKIAKKWCFSNAQQDTLYWLIDNHLKIATSLKMSSVKRHTFMMHPLFPLLLKVFEADKR
jgi:hypothetical protein